MATCAINVVPPGSAAWIEAALLAELRQRAPQGRNETMTLSVDATDCRQIAALHGSTSYGWLLVKLLWVDPDVRRQGHGRALIAKAMQRAKELGCHSVWLDTSDKDAKTFYTSLGFEVFGLLANQGAQVPAGHQRWFLKRDIP